MSEEAVTQEKAKTILNYMKNKVQQSAYIEEMSKLVYDYIDYGNCFAETVYVHDTHVDADSETTIKYIGPKINRISPYNIVFDVNAKDFQSTPKIVRSVLSLGELKALKESVPESLAWVDKAIDRTFDTREKVANGSYTEDDLIRNAISIDGFGSIYDYYNSGKVEVLEFYGDFYDQEKDELHSNYKTIVIDRAIVVYAAPIDGWLGRSPIEHVGWRQRPDNLMAMGPLDNLVGMQYRIDHLENLKADVFDQIAHPVVVHYGEVEDWEFGPGQRAYADQDARVEFIRPDATALNADFQIRELETKMEDMAGAPRQAMGIRTPGEKTAHEVQTLENNSGRIFQHKTTHFDRHLNSRNLNQMLASARKNIELGESIRVQDPDTGVIEFQTIAKEDITGKGQLVPKGAYHFARKAQIYQNLAGFVNSAAYADPDVKSHISGIELAKLTQHLLDLDEYKGLVLPNIRIAENTETQKAITSSEEEVSADASIDPEMVAEDASMLGMGEMMGPQDV